MPVDKTRYPTSWPKVSKIIRSVAGNQCEWCGVLNGAPLPSGRAGRVVLTVAHIGAPFATGDGWRPGDKHNKHDIRRENLRALCQRCHLRYDIDEHVQNARVTRQRKKRDQAARSGQLSLFPDF